MRPPSGTSLPLLATVGSAPSRINRPATFMSVAKCSGVSPATNVLAFERFLENALIGGPASDERDHLLAAALRRKVHSGYTIGLPKCVQWLQHSYVPTR